MLTLVLNVDSVRHFALGGKRITEITFLPAPPATGRAFTLAVDYEPRLDGILGASIVVPLEAHIKA